MILPMTKGHAQTETDCLTINIAHNNRIWMIQLNEKLIISTHSQSREETLLKLSEF